MSSPDPRGHIVLFAASMVSMALGSIHAFSVFLEPLETMFEAPRGTVSVVYSFGLVFLTTAVLFGPAIYSRLQPATIFIAVALLGGAGACIAGVAGSLEAVFVGYSLIFGVANGLGYGFGLQFAARANPHRSGFAMGVVTAAYALGAVLAPFGFEVALALGGFSAAMFALAAVVSVTGIVAAILVARSRVQYKPAEPVQGNSPLPHGQIAAIWFAYGCGVAAGLMAIGHAAGIATAAGFSGWMAATAIAGCNLLGSLLSGALSDRISHRRLLMTLPLLGAAALLGLAALPGFSIAFLGIVGFAYGGTIATYPAAIAILFPDESGPRAYGRVFTAWGAAGLLAPWLAGRIYDWHGSYTLALWLAAGLGVISAATARRAFA